MSGNNSSDSIHGNTTSVSVVTFNEYNFPEQNTGNNPFCTLILYSSNISILFIIYFLSLEKKLLVIY